MAFCIENVADKLIQPFSAPITRNREHFEPVMNCQRYIVFQYGRGSINPCENVLRMKFYII